MQSGSILVMRHAEKCGDLAWRLSLPIDTSVADQDYGALAHTLTHEERFEGALTVMCGIMDRGLPAASGIQRAKGVCRTILQMAGLKAIAGLLSVDPKNVFCSFIVFDTVN